VTPLQKQAPAVNLIGVGSTRFYETDLLASAPDGGDQLYKACPIGAERMISSQR
jgi:hypothetical protein